MADAAILRLCACKKNCGDVPEGDDHPPQAVCKDLPVKREPLVEIEVVHRGY